MPIGLSIFVYNIQRSFGAFNSSQLQQLNQTIRQWHRPRFVRLQGETCIFFATYVISLLGEINLAPGGILYFAVSACCPEKKLVTNWFAESRARKKLSLYVLGWIHRREQSPQVSFLVRHCYFLFNRRHFISRYSGDNAILLQQEKYDI